MIREATEKVVNKIDLSEAEMRGAFDEIMSGEAAHADTVAFLVALRKKGETVEEITAAAKVMREKAIKVDAGSGLVDTCGTGGSAINTFNVSTTAALVASGAGVRIAKHGNRSASSQCGSADVLEALGVKLDIGADHVGRCIREVGIGFIFAPLFHSAMKHAAQARKEIGTRTIFNIIGPLSNPAGASNQLVGVYDGRLTETIAGVLKNLGLKSALVVHGLDGLDEITITDKTKIAELKSGKTSIYYVSPEEFGIKRGRLEDIKGGNAEENKDILMSILKGKRGPPREIVLLNSSAALVCGGKARDLKEGIRLAADSIDSGKALDKLEKLIEFTNRI